MHTRYDIVSEGLYHERFGLAFEDLRPGLRFAHRPGITLSQQDNVDEALDSCNAAMVHYDERYASLTSWKRPLMVSTRTIQCLVGMTAKTFGRRRRIVSMESIAMSRPVFGGDTLYAETEVMTLDPTGEGWGSATLRTVGLNQRSDVVATLEYTVELWCRGRGPGETEARQPALEPRFASHVQRADGSWVEQTGLYFEDLRADETFMHWPRRSVLAEEAISHALRSFEWTGIHHDLELAQSVGERAPAVTQTWVIAIVAALTTRTFGRVSANLGWNRVRFGSDVQVGDTISARSTVLETRLSASRPDEGIATVRTEAFNQNDEPVLSYQRTLLVYKRSGQAPYESAGY
jgi:itaconyl-CoA hydratase